MAKRNRSVARLGADLHALSASVPEDLFVPSLREQPSRLHGHAYKFYIVLPMYSAQGQPVFTPEHLLQLYSLFSTRFGGSLAPSARSGAPYFGEYMPEGTEPIRDYHTVVTIYANPIEPSDRFFRDLKEILRRAPLIPQDEILIERSEVFLV